MNKYDFDAVINNEFITTKNKLNIVSPSDLKIIGTVPTLDAKQVDLAYQSARKAQPNWEKTPLLKRIAILKQWRDLILSHQQELATIMMSEVGKSYKDSITEILRTIEYMDYTFEEAKRVNPYALTGKELGVENKYAIFEYVAKGVGLAVSPFNYPINLAMSKIAPALVMGNTLVFKPASAGSLTGAMLGRLGVEAGLPSGIFNVVTGKGSEIGDLITINQELDFISFTGSVPVGKNILKTASTKDVVLELGGKDPALVLDDLDLQKYASEIVSGAFSYSGQRCTAIKRVITTNKIADQLVPLIKNLVDKLTVGMPDINSDIVPVIDLKSADYVWELIQDAKQKGAKVIVGDKREKNLLWPTILDYVSKDMSVAWEEPFGPVLPIIRIDNVDEMVKMANDSNFALQASVFSQNISQAISVAKQIKTGTVNINGKTQRGPDSFSFSGIKDSGFGVQGIRDALLSVVRVKGLVINY